MIFWDYLHYTGEFVGIVIPNDTILYDFNEKTVYSLDTGKEMRQNFLLRVASSKENTSIRAG